MPKLFRHGKHWCCVFIFNGERIWFNTGETDFEKAKIRRDEKYNELRATKNGRIVENVRWDTVKEAFYKYLEARKRSKTSIETYQYSFKQFEIYTPIRYFSELTLEKMDDYCRKRKDGVKEATLNRHITCLKKICSFAVAYRYSDHHQLKGYPKYQVRDIVREKFFSKDEITRLFSKVQSRALKTLFYLCYYAGLSPTDAITLKWDQVDFEKGLITYTRDKIEKKHPNPTRVPLNSKLRDYLIELRKVNQYDYICCYDDGAIVTANTASVWTKKIMRRAGLGECTLYTFRHTFISHLIMAGVDSTLVSMWAGHKNINQIKPYLHLSPTFQKENIDKLL